MLAEAPAPVRRILRFLALPYCYFVYVNWKECPATRLQVAKDFFYIFFYLKYFPINYSLCRLWEKPREEWKFYYGSVYDAWQRSRLRKEVFPLVYRIVYDDKSLTHRLCEANGLPVPEFMGIINPDECRVFLDDLFKKHPEKTFIIKPLSGRGGKDIFLACLNNGQIFIRGNYLKGVPLNNFILPSLSVVQECVQQHPELRQISQSVNTVRIVTMLTRTGEFVIIGAFMRFGVKNAFLDNTSQGGVTAGIKINTGALMRYAYDFDSRRYDTHPTTGFKFKGFSVPLWDEVVKVAEQAQRAISYNKLIGQDIAITENGPVIIELNAEYDNVGLEQVCGPILKNRQIVEAFDRYHLLVSKPQRSLL